MKIFKGSDLQCLERNINEWLEAKGIELFSSAYPREQSSPKILTVAVGALLRIFTDFIRCEAPFASRSIVGAVCPPAFTVPTALSVVSGRLSQPRTTFRI